MQQGEEFEPVFLAAQLCRTSGNSSQCIEAIQNVAKNMANTKGVSNRNDEFNKVQFGYDLDAIDSGLVSGAGCGSGLDYNISDSEGLENDTDFKHSTSTPTITTTSKLKEEMPSFHINKSKYFISGSSLIPSKQLKPAEGLENKPIIQTNPIPPPKPKTLAMAPPVYSQMAIQNPMASVILPESKREKYELVETETCSTTSSEDVILILGFIIPFLFIISFVWASRCEYF